MRTMRTTNNLLLSLIALVGAGQLQAQDGQLSQYDAAPVLLNPALTGMYENADFRMGSNVRSQWNSLSSSFLTTAFSYDMSMQRRYGFGSYLSNYNMAGIMNTFQFGVTGAYNVSDSKADHTLSVGVNLGLIYKKINDQQLVWDAQYDDGYFNSDLPSGEFMQRGARLMPEVSAGVAYRATNPRKRVNPFGNFALFHVTTPDEAILQTEESELHIRYSVNGGVRVKVMDQLILIPQGVYMRQGNDQMIHAGMLAEFNIGGSMYSVIGGGSYRLDDAIVVQAGLKHKNAMYRFSYDINTSPLKAYTNNNGAYEFSIIYYGTHSGRERRLQSSSF
jgi:type IX secretion system PorP/SprF family membrane protein